jgi:hypothetical protein
LLSLFPSSSLVSPSLPRRRQRWLVMRILIAVVPSLVLLLALR